MRLATSSRLLPCLLVSSRSSSRPAGRREKAVCIAYPQSCGGSEQRKVRGQAIDR